MIFEGDLLAPVPFDTCSFRPETNGGKCRASCISKNVGHRKGKSVLSVTRGLLASIAYQPFFRINPKAGPVGKLPFIVVNGKIRPNSGLIIDHCETPIETALDWHLINEQKDVSLRIRCLLEEHFYSTIVWPRGIAPIGFRVWKNGVTEIKGVLLGNLIVKTIKGKVIDELHGQGMGRHSRDAIYAPGIEDLNAVEAVLQRAPYLFGATSHHD